MKKFFFALLLTPLVCLSQTDSVKIEDLNTIAFKILVVGKKPDFIATDNDDAWIIDDHQNRIIKISPDQERPLLVVHLKDACTAPIVYFNFLWVMSCTDECLYKIDHLSGRILAKIKTGMADKDGIQVNNTLQKLTGQQEYPGSTFGSAVTIVKRSGF